MVNCFRSCLGDKMAYNFRELSQYGEGKNTRLIDHIALHHLFNISVVVAILEKLVDQVRK